ncbi:MAG TPA: hypothetical protein VLI54_02365 [Bacillota bacterium]|nr:hypothetical protein [Bacillota bacterium]
MIGIFETHKVPTTNVYQNHLDEMHEAFEEYCLKVSDYSWVLIDANKEVVGLDAIERYLAKNRPAQVSYLLISKDRRREMTVTIDNGIMLNLKNGDYVLLGFFSYFKGNVSKLKVPKLLVGIRRHWLASLLLTLWLLPAIGLTLFNQKRWAIGWLVGFLLLSLILFMQIVSQDNFKGEEWGELILKTKISYGKYNAKLGTPLYAFLTSSKTIISLLAALATIVSTVFLFVHKG